jgi:hypothetical protein
MNQDGLDLAALQRLIERREVLVAVRGRAPHPRRLVKDLNRLAATLGAARHRTRQPAGLRYVGAD